MESPSPESIFLEDFGQTVDLTRRIREVLLNYPEGTTVLKELIQNADDAGATKVCLCLDRRFHACESLLSDSLSQWQGPALLAYNNAIFTEEDFVSISRIGGSSKQAQAWKTGRFGVGFNSVYHLTDLPSFVSGKYVVLFDPQGIYLPKVSAANPGKRIDFTSSSVISFYKDQFFPYCTFGCDMKSPFGGTLFRFPLRNADQAARSKLSRQAYSVDDISSMFSQLYEEGILTLLFLKSVLCIEMYVWDAGEPEAKKLYSCSVCPANDNIVWHRQALLRMSKCINTSSSELDAFSVDFLSEAVCGVEIERRTERFHVVQTMASTSGRIGSFAATASKEYDIHLLPWASVAACVSDNSTNNKVLRTGQAFCFLPLPVRTGLNVQINGFFEVSSNRRGIWYGADMDRSGKVRSIWNRLLLEDVVAPSFIHLLLGLKDLLGPTDFYYSLWPVGSFEEPWSILVEKVYRNISNAAVLYSDLEGGTWVSPGEAFLHDEEFSKSKDLGLALVQLGMPVVHLPNPLFDMLLKYASSKVVTPGTVRQFLRECKILINLSKPYKLVLLEYCLEDLVDDDVGKEAVNLPLLPLANGDFGLISDASRGTSYFICDELEYMLLQPVSDRVIDQNIPPNILSRLSAVARSSRANLNIFCIDYFIQIFPGFMPADWKCKSEVFWDPESCQKPTSTWFLLFWQYLGNHTGILPLFSEWPILPSTSGHLLRPSRQSKLINPKGLSDRLQDILVKIGCNMLNPRYVVEHPDISDYVCNGNPVGVLESIFHASSNVAIMQPSIDSLTAEERNELRWFLLDPKWYVGCSMDELSTKVCKRLPIYQVYSRESAQDFQFSDLENPQKYLPPLDVPEFILGEEFIIRSSSIEEDVLSRYYGVVRMGKAQFYKKYIFDRVGELQSDVRDGIMLSVLQNLPLLSLEDTSIRDCLRNLEFVPTLTGSLKRASALYDPSNEELYALLEDTDNFPSGHFQEPEILGILRSLGLRTSVSPETVLESARCIERIMHEDQQKAYSRGKVLLSYLEVNALKWLPDQINDYKGAVNRMLSRAAIAFRSRNLKSDLEKFWSDLQMVSWCPVLASSPFQSLPWPVVSSMVAPPRLVRPQTDLWLVSAGMRILDGECSSTALLYSLGWMYPPGGSIIAAQLLELGKNNEIVIDQVLRQELALAMPRIYSILTGLIGSDEFDIVKAVLEGCRWIWVGDGFATSDEVVLDGPLHLAPYIRVIPVDLAVFKDLFLELGIREFLRPADYASILCRMADRKGSSPLDAQEIRAVMLIVHHLAEVQHHEQNVQIYLPDVSGRLFLAGDLVYNDAPWLLGTEDSDASFGNVSTMAWNAKRKIQKFVHGNISNDIAEKLGVCSLRRILLAESADSMNLGLSGAAEAFGQHEALTTRLKHILEMYADGPGTLFELVQNAEDAGASEVIFLLDKSQYGTSSVLSPEMADWQGPALYCFNDSVFSPQDLYAISRIGQESKLEKPFAIGRFGLGFNCVYHFTDIPMFVSGENIVMFDPHSSSLPGISPSHPGLRIKFLGRQILEQFPDQFSPFLHFGCDLQQPFPGTLFRFPLRNASVASRSQIKKEAYTAEDVRSLFAAFAEVVSETLLFLRNVKTISIFMKDGTGHEMHLLHRVRRTCVGEPKIGSTAAKDMFNLFNENRHVGMNREQLLKKLSKSIDRDLPYKCQKLLIVEQSTSGNNSHCWVITECLGGGNAHKNSALTSNYNSHNFVPWACVSVYLNSVKLGEDLDAISGEENDHLVSQDAFQVVTSIHPRENFEGRAFCFLPLPISTGLPVHVNAYFELSSNRRDIWFGSDMTGGGRKRSEWNIYLLEDVVAPAYGHLLEKVASEVGPCDLFFSLWPTTIGLEPWASVVRKLYRFVAESGLCVLYTEARGGQWVSTKHAIFPDFTFHKAVELIKALSGACLPVVRVPQSLVERFMEICPSLHFLTPKLLRTLLIRRRREFTDNSAMILTLEYCLLDLDVSMKFDTLYGLSLLPLADGSFTTIDKKGVGERVYIARGDEYGLLKDSIPHQLVECGIPEEVHKKLCYIAQSDSTNISFLSCQLLEKLFVKLLPVEWQNARQVSWSPGILGQPSLEWLQLLWNYLRSYCDDLSIFSKWPILPVGSNSLMQLRPNSNVIKNDGWSEKMSTLLLKVGCLFLRHDLQVDHPQLEYFVQSPTAKGVLDVFLAIAGNPEKIEGIFADASEGELHELRSFVLQSKWFSEDQMDRAHTEIIKHLPIFESYKSRKLVSLRKLNKWLGPTGVREDLLDDNFLRTESEMERVILRSYLEIKEPSKVEFYKDHIFKNMSEFLLKQDAVPAIVHDLKILIEEDISIKSELSAVPFVLATNESWQKPSRLYDPRVPQLQKMLHGNAFFPSEKFLDTEVLDFLVSLGLRRSLGYTGLLDCARSVSLLHDAGETGALKCGRELLGILDSLALQLSNNEVSNIGDLRNGMSAETSDLTNVAALDDGFPKRDENYQTNNEDTNPFVGSLIDDMEEEEFWSEMKLISWCPKISDPPVRGLPWLKSSNQVASPSVVRPKSQMWLVSSSMHVLDGECHSAYLQTKLGWMDSPKAGVLSRQLVELSKSYKQLKMDSLGESDFDTHFQKVMPYLYLKMQEYINSDDFIVLKSGLDGVAWVWIGDDFVSPDALAFDSPVKFTPYLYVVPSELSEYKDLLIKLGVRLNFGIWDYIHVLQRLQNDVQGAPLSTDQLNFVHCVLEAIAECCSEKLLFEPSDSPLLMPDASGILMHTGDLVYNDAPWLENNSLIGKHFVHPSINNDLADKLGVQSVRCLSLVSEDMIKNLPCMDYDKVNEFLTMYGNNDYLMFDLLELADCCKAKKLHLIYDKREHPRQSLLQHNLGEFQGPALVAILEGACLSGEEVSNLQLLPPWRLRGETLNYGLGLISCYFICELLSIVSSGYFYMFDPRGLVLAAPSTCAPSAKMFSLIGTDLAQRFCDQFSPMLINENELWPLSDSTIIRMPLSSKSIKDESDPGTKRIRQITDRFIELGSRALLFMKSVLQVSISTWEEGSSHPCQNYSVCIDPSSAVMRNPFSEKKWRKFHISRLFSSSNTAIKMHVIDVTSYAGGTKSIDRWLLVLSLGSGQTRNMALDRRYLAYNLTPVAGVAALISRNGHNANAYLMSSIMSPLPLSGFINTPVTVLGCFLVCHNKGRYLFKYQDKEASSEAHFDVGNQLIESWNRELMSCVCDSYVEMVLEMQKLRSDVSSSFIDSSVCPAINLSLKAYGDQIYSFWPRSEACVLSGQFDDCNNSPPTSVVLKADWECLKERVIRPFYSRVVDLPAWQLYSGKLVKAEEGMFLSQPGNGVIDSLLPATVCSFVKEHYPVFSVPWELVNEIRAVGFSVREIKPKMVRDLLKISSTPIVLRSVDMYIDVLEYCLSDFQQFGSSSSLGDDVSIIPGSSSTTSSVIPGSSSTNSGETNIRRSYSRPESNMNSSIGLTTQGAGSSGDALEMMTSLGKALFDIGRGVIEDIGRAGGPMVERNANAGSSIGSRQYRDEKFISIAAELKGLPCPTATNHLTKLGFTELWLGNKDQQSLMVPLGAKFIHPKVLERQIMSDLLSNLSIQELLKLHNFSHNLLAKHMKLIFHEDWVNHVMSSNMAPWLSWEKLPTSGGQGGPSPEWIRIFWKCFSGSQEDLSLFSDWPLIPAFLGRPVLCRVRERNLVFIPPILEHPVVTSDSEREPTVSYLGGVSRDNTSEADLIESYISSFERFKDSYPWLLPMLNQCNIPIFDVAFLDCAASSNCFPTSGQSLGQVITSKLVAAKQAGYFSEPTNFSASNRDDLFSLFANEFFSNGSSYRREEIEALRSLPIYKTVVGSYTKLQGQDQCMISSNSFLKPHDDHCLSYSTDSSESSFLRALGVLELHDQQILVRFGLPDFEKKPQSEQEDILIYLYTNWHDLQSDQSVVEALKEARFVRNSDEFSVDFLKPKELFDPGDALLISIFSHERKKFPGERFSTDGWLQILRKLGLRTSTEVDVILECAKRVESLGSEHMKSGDLDDFETDVANSQNEVSMEIWALAGSVVEFVFSNFALYYSNQFCDLLGKIVCIPAELGFPNVGSKRVLTSYKEAILIRDWPLAWSSAPILSKQHIVPPEYSWGALHLRSPPAFSIVLKHLKVIGNNGGEDTLAHWPVASGVMNIEECTCEILKYLDKVWGSLSSSDVKELQRVAFLPAANGTRLVTADALFARLVINLSPFAFELPTVYLPFVKILKDLGLQDTLTLSSAKDLLSNLQKACGYQHLNPNELRAVMEILNFICDQIIEGNIVDRSDWKSEAIIPDDGCRLVHSASCVYIDSYGSQFVKCIDTSRIRFVHPDLPERICITLGIKKLSDVVIEELDNDEPLQTLGSMGSVSLPTIKQKLTGRSLQAAVWTVVNSMGSYIPAMNNLALDTMKSLLNSTAEKLRFVKHLKTKFLLLPNLVDVTRATKDFRIPEWHGQSVHQTLYFVNQSCILVAEPPTYISVFDLTAIVVSQVLGSPTVLPIGPLFVCPEGSEIAVVNVLKLCFDKKEVDPVSGSSTLIGKEILAQDARLVQLHPLRPFYSSEIVAWRSQNGEKLKYGRVPEDVRPMSGQALYRFKVEIAPGVIELLLSSQVFSFKSVAAGRPHREPETLVDDSLSTSGSKPFLEVPETSGRGKSSSQLQPLRELQYGKVSAAELVQAVNEILNAAGINMDAEKQALLQRTIALQENLKESQAALLLEQEKADAAAKEADTAKAAWLCRICLTAEVDITIVPCGHVLCRRCSSAVSKCPFCRLQVTKTVRIFRP